MYLQGNLQLVFDALYNLGVIDPVLEKDWQEALEVLPQFYDTYSLAIVAANDNQKDLGTMMHELKEFDDRTLEFLAMEVAREFADFHTREDIH